MNNTFDAINAFSFNLSKLLLGLGLIFIILKLVSLTLNSERFDKKFNRIKFTTYVFHKMIAIGTMLAIIHGFLVITTNQNSLLLGWVAALLMVILTGLGLFLGFQNNWQPFSTELNLKFRKIRTIKWILTIFLIGFIALHIFI